MQPANNRGGRDTCMGQFGQIGGDDVRNIFVYIKIFRRYLQKTSFYETFAFITPHWKRMIFAMDTYCIRWPKKLGAPHVFEENPADEIRNKKNCAII